MPISRQQKYTEFLIIDTNLALGRSSEEHHQAAQCLDCVEQA
jgi:hypothetical protein